MHILNDLPPNSNVWAYAADRTFTEDESVFLENELTEFTTSWTAHSEKLRAVGLVLYRQFILLAVDASLAQASGCSIDTSIRVLKKLEQTLNCTFFDRMKIYYKTQEGTTSWVTFASMKAAYTTGIITDTTPIYDTSITSVKELQDGWPVPLNQSKYYRLIH